MLLHHDVVNDYRCLESQHHFWFIGNVPYFLLQVVLYVKEEMKRNELPEPAVIGLLWTCVMNAVEWNKKEELVAEQALKHLKVCGWVKRRRML